MNWNRKLIGRANSHWTHAGLTFVLTILAAGILLPLLRVYPESVHKFFTRLSDWLRISFILFLCIVFTVAMFRLLSPRIGHLAHWRSYPPAWLAALLAWLVVAVIDVVGGFDPNGYRASLWEWLGYGGISFVVGGAQVFGRTTGCPFENRTLPRPEVPRRLRFKASRMRLGMKSRNGCGLMNRHATISSTINLSLNV